MEKEIRQFSLTELRALEDDKKIQGYAAVFNSLSEKMFGFREKIAQGAFIKSLQSRDVMALWSHDSSKILGSTKSKSLQIREDPKGLYFELSLPDTNIGNDAYKDIKRGDVTGMSIGFMVNSDTWEKGKEGEPHIRTLNEIELHEISPVAFPAYSGTSVHARSLEQVIKEKEVEWDKEERKSPTLDIKWEQSRLLYIEKDIDLFKRWYQ